MEVICTSRQRTNQERPEALRKFSGIKSMNKVSYSVKKKICNEYCLNIFIACKDFS